MLTQNLQLSDFSVGPVWRMRNGDEFFVERVTTAHRHAIFGKDASGKKMKFLLNGRFSVYNETPFDLVQLVIFTRQIQRGRYETKGSKDF